MCGILLAFTRTGSTRALRRTGNRAFNVLDIPALHAALQKISHRGPDSTTFEYSSLGGAEFFLGFVRLAIMDTTHASDQPIRYKDVSVLCNGEIYNPEELYHEQGTNDCAGLAEYFHSMDIWSADSEQRSVGEDDGEQRSDSISAALARIRGVFGMIVVNKDTEQIIVARDPLGVRPIFYAVEKDVVYVASEGKALMDLLDFSENGENTVRELGPGEWFGRDMHIHKYYSLPTSSTSSTSVEGVVGRIGSLLMQAVQRRIESSRPRAYLLSGGVDSSAIAAIAAKLESSPVHTYSVGFPNSADLIAARRVAKHIGSVHHEIPITFEDAICTIPEVIINNESYDQTTTRASTPMYILLREIARGAAQSTSARVIFSGEGADELFGGYLYFHRAPSSSEAFLESRRLTEELPLYDVRRTDRSCAGNGLEARVPFLDVDFVDFVMSTPWEYRRPREHTLSDGRTVLFEKWLLREAISQIDSDLLPEDILWRPKVAFSDGVASAGNSWYGAIQQHVRNVVYPDSTESGSTLESLWYREIFDREYDNGTRLYKGVTQQWLPRWITVDGESSAMVFAESIHVGAHG